MQTIIYGHALKMTSFSLSTVKMFYNITSLKRGLRTPTFSMFFPNST